jgi:hypothetical protein
MKVIVWGKYYLKVLLLTSLTYAQATEIPTTQKVEDIDKWELEKRLLGICRELGLGEREKE